MVVKNAFKMKKIMDQKPISNKSSMRFVQSSKKKPETRFD
jgi:hypothetical protein